MASVGNSLKMNARTLVGHSLGLFGGAGVGSSRIFLLVPGRGDYRLLGMELSLQRMIF